MKHSTPKVIRYREVVDPLNATHNQIDGKQYLSFDRNDYLGLSAHPDIIESAQNSLKTCGFGTRSSALLAGYSSEHQALEQELARFFNVERAICFSTGYMANVGLISTLFDSRSRILMDRRVHASIVDGVRLSGAKFSRYRETPQKLDDFDALITEGVFSMDGDFAAIEYLLNKLDDQQLFIVDDAHAIGWTGHQGRGTSPLTPPSNMIIVGTMSKSFGCHGAFVAGSSRWCELLVQSARSYIYTTALPPHIFAAARCALHIIQTDERRKKRLLHNIDFFQRLALQKKLPAIPSHSPIQGILLKDNERTVLIKKTLKNMGILTQAIRPPTVPQGLARLRISLNSEHTPSHIEQLLEAVEHALTTTTT